MVWLMLSRWYGTPGAITALRARSSLHLGLCDWEPLSDQPRRDMTKPSALPEFLELHCEQNYKLHRDAFRNAADRLMNTR